MIGAGKKVFNLDKPVKIIFIPVLGIIIPNITGLITNGKYSILILIIYYVLFIVIAWIIWQGNIKLMIILKNKLNTSPRHYYKSIAALLVIVGLFTFLISLSTLSVWFYVSEENASGFYKVFNTSFVITVVGLFITNLYEVFFLNQERTDILSRVENLNVAKTHAELVALKNQIDPHFIFNSLNTLSYLISFDPSNAKLYNDTLAKVYQYILSNREKNFVTLAEELEFISNYFYLLKIRFHYAIDMIIEINNISSEELLLPPISLQILVENVMKHNEINQQTPLMINIQVSKLFVSVKNKVRPKEFAAETSKVGLNNLDNRYKLLTGKNIIVQSNSEAFVVRLPLINLNI